MGGETKQNWLIAVPEIIMADSAFIYLINLMIVVTRFVRDSLVKYLLLVVVSVWPSYDKLFATSRSGSPFNILSICCSKQLLFANCRFQLTLPKIAE